MSKLSARSFGLLPAVIAAAALLVPAGALAGPPVPPYPSEVIVGTPDPDTLYGFSRSDIIFGLAGDDLIYGNHGADRIFAGPGADGVRGGHGPDTIRGGAGEDKIGGGPGNDLILAAGDGEVDRVWCGDGRQDLAIVDPTDRVANDCEFVWQRDPEV